MTESKRITSRKKRGLGRALRSLGALTCLVASAVYGQATQEDQKVTASDGAAGDRFGYPVRIDGTRAVVGATSDDDGGTDTGSAYVYEYNGSAWIETAKLTASDGAAGDAFGTVDISGNRIAVGALGDDDGGTDAGSAYVYEYNGTAWIETKLGNGSPVDRYGQSVSIDGERILVGSPQDDDGAADAGTAFIYDYNGSAWVQSAILMASDRAPGDRYGWNVVLRGDRAFIGSIEDDDNGTGSGSIYVYDYNGTAWVETAKLTASDGAADDGFGERIAVDGNRLVAGVQGNDDGGAESGSAYIFEYNGSNWVETAKLTASDAAADDRFGLSVSLSGDRLLVGAPQDDDGAADSGSIYVFGHNGSTWVEIDKLAASDAGGGDRFGWSSALSGDFVITGALDDDDNGTDSGSVYFFDLNVDVTAPDLTATYNAAVTVPITLGEAVGLVAAEIFLEYDTSLLTFNGINSVGTLTDGWSVQTNTEAGVGTLEIIKVALATDQNAATGAATLVEFNFTVEDVRTPASSPLALTHVLLNNGSPGNAPTSGSLVLVGNDATGSTDVASVIPREDITVTITDIDEDLDGAGSTNQVTVAVSNGLQTETLTLNETATPGEFAGTISTVFSASSTAAANSGDNIVQAQAGDQIDFGFVDQLLSDGSGPVVLDLTPVDVIGGTDGTAQITDATQPGDAVYLKVVDADLNADNGVAETVQVVITSSNGESEAVTLTEVDVDDEIFFGSLASATGAAGIDDDGTINGVKGDLLTLTYDDVVTALGDQLDRIDTDQVVDPFGDADGNGAVQAFDAANALLHVLSPFLTGLELIQTNVDTDPVGTGVTPFDASLILQKRVGLIPIFPVQLAASTNHPQATPASPKGAVETRYLALSHEDGYLSLSADDRTDILSGDLLIAGVEGKVVMSDELAQFAIASRQTDQGLRVVFAGAEAVSGPGELLRLYPGVGPDRASLARAQLNDGRIQALTRELDVTASPLSFALHANAPNPFNPVTQIRFDLPAAGPVELTIYDMLGQKVHTLLSSSLAAGSHQIEWNGRDASGMQVSSGVYFYRLQAGGLTQMRSMMLLK